MDKSKLHPRNKHKGRYDFKNLIAKHPELSDFVLINKYDIETVDFSNSRSVRALNTALLKSYYNISNWDIPNDYLCPPIPGRSDYIHYVADLLGNSQNGLIPRGKNINCLDIGVGANCIYPIVGVSEYDWSFKGTDIDKIALESAQKIINSNFSLKGKIDLKLQSNSNDIFAGAIGNQDYFDITICNPPFNSSMEETKASNLRKVKNLGGSKENTNFNFGGRSNELWCEGGEISFVSKMILQSKDFANSCFWFTTLISKESNLKIIYGLLNKVGAKQTKTVEMGQGNKKSRFVAWTFLSQEQQKKWAKIKWI